MFITYDTLSGFEILSRINSYSRRPLFRMLLNSKFRYFEQVFSVPLHK